MSNWLKRLFGGQCACHSACHKGGDCCKKDEKCCHDADGHGHCCSHEEENELLENTTETIKEENVAKTE